VPLVTFEGGEGCGKSTQLGLAARRLRERGLAVVETREPGGTAVGARLREVLMDPDQTALDPVTEWLLMEADRRQHVREVVKPGIESGAFVLCDRYSDSTEAYQGGGRGIDLETIRSLDSVARDGVVPDLTLLYDVDPEEGLARARARDGERGARFEAADLEFHRRVRRAYLEIARREPERVAVIPARDGAEEVFARTWERIERLLAGA